MNSAAVTAYRLLPAASSEVVVQERDHISQKMRTGARGYGMYTVGQHPVLPHNAGPTYISRDLDLAIGLRYLGAQQTRRSDIRKGTQIFPPDAVPAVRNVRKYCTHRKPPVASPVICHEQTSGDVVARHSRHAVTMRTPPGHARGSRPWSHVSCRMLRASASR